ncbi:MAG TPA: hypothetical protein VL172_18480 [Kofleriaceae bacterium]|nr:hypothetical protein [Kofleriaceae bacterium]
MTTSLLCVAMLALAGCPAGREAQPPQPLPPELRAACALTSHRCTQCHSLDRVFAAQVGGPLGWRPYVDRMRHQPGSLIPEAETPTLVRCLVFWSFGEAGLATLDADGDAP